MTIFEQIALFAGYTKVTDSEPYGLSYWVCIAPDGNEFSDDTALEVCKFLYASNKEIILQFCETEIHKRIKRLYKQKYFTMSTPDQEKYAAQADFLVCGLQPIVDIGFTFPEKEHPRNIYFYFRD